MTSSEAWVLVVAESPGLRTILGRALEGVGYEVATAASGIAALTVATSWRFAVGVIAEPVGDLGTAAVLDGLRSRPDAPALPVVVLGEASGLRELGDAGDLTVRLPRPVRWSAIAEAVADLADPGTGGHLLRDTA